MRHQDVHILNLEFEEFRTSSAHLAMINIATYSTHDRRYGFEPAYDVYTAYITGMPYLVASTKVKLKTIVPA